jgi:hypothetical protein
MSERCHNCGPGYRIGSEGCHHGRAMGGDVERVAEALIQHQRIPLYDGTGGQRCVGCDSLYGETDGPNSPRHAEHLAAVLLAPGGVVAGMVAARGSEAYEDGYDQGHADAHADGAARDSLCRERERGAAEVRARVEAVLGEYDHIDRLMQRSSVGTSPTLVQRIRAALADPEIGQGGPLRGQGAPEGPSPVSVDPGDELGPENGAHKVCGRCFIERSANGTCGCEGDEK